MVVDAQVRRMQNHFRSGGDCPHVSQAARRCAQDEHEANEQRAKAKKTSHLPAKRIFSQLAQDHDAVSQLNEAQSQSVIS